ALRYRIIGNRVDHETLLVICRRRRNENAPRLGSGAFGFWKPAEFLLSAGRPAHPDPAGSPGPSKSPVIAVQDVHTVTVTAEPGTIQARPLSRTRAVGSLSSRASSTEPLAHRTSESPSQSRKPTCSL